MANSINKKEIDMTNGPLFGKLVRFTIPVILSGILQLLFNACDIVVVGRFAGHQSLAAVGSTSSLCNLFVAVFMGLSVGANVVVAQLYGADEKDRVRSAVHTSISIAIISGIFMLVIGVLASSSVLKLMGSPEDVIDLATLYLRIYFFSVPAMLIYNFGASILRAIGNTKTPLYFLTIAGVINVLLNLLLVIRFSMGVAGVAIATVVSQVLSAGMMLLYLSMRDDELKFSVNRLEIDRPILTKILKVGLPAGIQGSLFSFSNVIIQSSVNSFGSVVIAGNSAASNIEGFVYFSMNAVYQTAITFTGQNYGAGKYKRIIKVLFQCLGIVTVIGLVLGNAAYLFGHDLLSIYNTDEEVIAAGLVRLSYICTIYFMCGVMDTLVGVLRGVGNSLIPMICSLTFACGFRILWIFTIFQVYHTTEMLYITYILSWTLTTIAHVIVFVITYRHITSLAEKGSQI